MQLKDFNNSMIDAMNEIQQSSKPQETQQTGELSQLLEDYESIKEGNDKLADNLEKKDQQIKQMTSQIIAKQEEKEQQ